jgi:hypothetical protein
MQARQHLADWLCFLTTQDEVWGVEKLPLGTTVPKTKRTKAILV